MALFTLHRILEGDKMTLNEFINAAIVGCMVFLALVCLLKKNNTPTGYGYLALFFILLSLIFVGNLLEDGRWIIHYPWLSVLFEPVIFAFPPTLFLAVKHLTTTERKTAARIVSHFIPYFLLVVVSVLSYLTTDRIAPPAENQSTGWEVTIVAGFVIQVSAYLYLSLKQLKKHEHALPHLVSNFSGNDLSWLYNIIIGMCVIVAVVVIEFVFEEVHIESYFSFLYLAGFYYIGIQIVNQKDVLPLADEASGGVYTKEDKEPPAEQPEPAQILPDENEGVLKAEGDAAITPRRQVMSEEKRMELCARLLVLMEERKPYLDSEITLPRLSALLQLTTYQTSYLINTCFQENFYVFINRYRLEQCKKLLLDPRLSHLSILGIAFDSGFNSKTAFNTSFKKYTGLSPKEFREQNARPND